MTRRKLPTYGADKEDKETGKKKRLLRSPLRKTLKALRDLEPKSLENIKNAVEGVAVDKQALDTSRWIINNLVTISKAAVQEELDINGVKLQNEAASQAEEEEQEDDAPKSRFSLHILPTNKDV